MASNSTNVGALIVSGLAAGCARVAVGPDHTSAFLVLSAGSSWRAGELGALWGVGHALSLFLMASIYLATDRSVDGDGAAFVFDFFIGMFLLLLGLWALNKHLDIRKRVGRGDSVRAILRGNGDDQARLFDDLEEASRASSPSILAGFGPFWTTTESLQLDLERQYRPLDALKLAGRRCWCSCSSSCSHSTRRVVSLAYGVLHGLAGQGSSLAALRSYQVLDSYGKCMAYLLAETVASAVTMASFAALFGELSGRAMRWSDVVYYRVGIASALVSLAVGLLWIVLAEAGELDDVFGGRSS